MTWFEAAAIAVQNQIHIRRASWSSKEWIFPLSKTTHYGIPWIVFPNPAPANKPQQVIRATDFGAAEFLADDWTTVPAPLTSCPVTPTEPIGGNPPPSRPPWGTPVTPGGGAPSFPPDPGSGGGGSGGEGGGGSLPPPNPGTSLSVQFKDIAGGVSAPFYGVSVGDFNGSHLLNPAGDGVWTKTFNKGYESPDGGNTHDYGWIWTIKAFRVDNGEDNPPSYVLSITDIVDTLPGVALTPVYGSFQPALKGQWENNTYPAGSIGYSFSGGQGRVN